jgi:hypothetical protein
MPLRSSSRLKSPISLSPVGRPKVRSGNSELETDRTGAERRGQVQNSMQRCDLGEVKSTNLVTFLIATTMKSNQEKINEKNCTNWDLQLLGFGDKQLQRTNWTPETDVGAD